MINSDEQELLLPTEGVDIENAPEELSLEAQLDTSIHSLKKAQQRIRIKHFGYGMTNFLLLVGMGIGGYLIYLANTEDDANKNWVIEQTKLLEEKLIFLSASLWNLCGAWSDPGEQGGCRDLLDCCLDECSSQMCEWEDSCPPLPQTNICYELSQKIVDAYEQKKVVQDFLWQPEPSFDDVETISHTQRPSRHFFLDVSGNFFVMCLSISPVIALFLCMLVCWTGYRCNKEKQQISKAVSKTDADKIYALSQELAAPAPSEQATIKDFLSLFEAKRKALARWKVVEKIAKTDESSRLYWLQQHDKEELIFSQIKSYVLEQPQRNKSRLK